MIGVRFHYEAGIANGPRYSKYPDLWNRLASYWSPGYAGSKTQVTGAYGYSNPAGMLRTVGQPVTNAVNIVPQPIGQAWNFGTGRDRSIDFKRDHRSCGISGDSSWTLAGWINPSTTANAMGVIKLGDDSVALKAISIYLNVTGAGVLSGEWAGGNGARSNTGIVTANIWQHVAVVKYAGAINTTSALYINGRPVTIASASTGTPNTTFVASDRIGRFAGAGDKYGGYIGEIGVWARAMRPCEIMSLATGASPLILSDVRKRRQYVSIPLVIPRPPLIGKRCRPILKYWPGPARRSGESMYPRLWDKLKCVWSPAHSKNQVIRDYGPLGFHMTIQGNALLVPSETGIGLYMPGDPTSYATSGRPFTSGEFEDLTSNPAFSMSAWVKPSAFHRGSIIKWGNSLVPSEEASLFVNAFNSGQISLEMAGTRSAFSAAVDLFKDQEWVHLALTKSAGAPNTTTKLYVNGNFVALDAASTVSTPGITATENVELGRANSNFALNGKNENFKGVIGECAIWARVLSPKEIQMLFSGKSPLQRKPTRLSRFAAYKLIPHRTFATIFN